MDAEDPLTHLRELIEKVETHLAAKEWQFLGLVLTQTAMEAMTLAEKAQDGGKDLDPDYAGEDY